MIFFRAGPGTYVPMYVEIANELIVAMGRQPHKPGEVSLEQLPDVLARLRHAFEDSVTHAPFAAQLPSAPNGSPYAVHRRSEISLAERAVPLIELFDQAQRTRNPVRWS